MLAMPCVVWGSPSFTIEDTPKLTLCRNPRVPPPQSPPRFHRHSNRRLLAVEVIREGLGHPLLTLPPKGAVHHHWPAEFADPLQHADHSQGAFGRKVVAETSSFQGLLTPCPTAGGSVAVFSVFGGCSAASWIIICEPQIIRRVCVPNF